MFGSSTLRVGALALLIVVVSSSCRSVEETDNFVSRPLTDLGATVDPSAPNTAATLSRVQFDDIPVPDGFFFRNQRNESFAFQDGKARVGRFVYWGLGRPDTVMATYLEKMSKDPYNWTLESAPSSAEETAVWVKDGQRCEIRLDRERHRADGGLLIKISVEDHRGHDDEEP